MRFVLFILSPFLTFVYSCFDIQKRSSQVIFVLFFALFGYCHNFEDVRADSYRKSVSFTQYGVQDVELIIDDYRHGDIKDIYESLLFSLVKRFTRNPHLLMMVVGLLGGLFYMLVVRRFAQDKRMRYSLPMVILMAFMVMESNIPLLGGIRNFSAFPLFVYSLIRVMIDGRKWWVVGLMLTPLIHFGYIIAVAATMVIWVVRIPSRLLHYMAVLACITSIFLDTSSYTGAVGLFVDAVDNDSVASRVSNYGSQDTDIHFNRSLTTQLTRLNNQISALFISIFLIYVRYNRFTLKVTDYTDRIYRLLLYYLFFSFSLISFSVVGQRFVYIAMVLLYLYMFNIYQDNSSSAVRWFITLMPLVYMLHIAWTIYNCYSVTGGAIYYMPLPLLLL